MTIARNAPARLEKYYSKSDVECLVGVSDEDSLARDTKRDQTRNHENPCLRFGNDIQHDIVSVSAVISNCEELSVCGERSAIWQAIECAGDRITKIVVDDSRKLFLRQA